MTNTQNPITIEDLKQATTVAELRQLWERSKRPNACQSPMSDRAAGGKLIEACINQAKSCKSAEEAQEVLDALVALGIRDTPKGMVLLSEAAMTKWLPHINSEEERGKSMEIFMRSLPI